MASSARSVRSKTAPDQRRPARQEEVRRPQLSLIEGGRTSANASSVSVGQKARNVISWASNRSTPLIHFVVALAFLSVCLLGSLLLRTQMVQNSFEASSVQSSISQLTQDVQDDQNKLDELQASLPDKAQQMGMVPQQGTNSVDLSGYQPPAAQPQVPAPAPAPAPAQPAGEQAAPAAQAGQQ
ncbi:hypothetical protein [Bombiscardovia apis]|nr:hypothetical protein [Bombiscardovia apis]